MQPMLTPLEHQWKRNAVNLLKGKAEKVEVFLNLSKQEISCLFLILMMKQIP